MWLPSSSQGHLCFCSTDLPLARTRWVQSRFSSHCPLSSHQRSWLTSETSIISSLKVFWERWELNLGPLGEKQVWYLCAMQPTMVINVFFSDQDLDHFRRPRDDVQGEVRARPTQTSLGVLRSVVGIGGPELPAAASVRRRVSHVRDAARKLDVVKIIVSSVPQQSSRKKLGLGPLGN